MQELLAHKPDLLFDTFSVIFYLTSSAMLGW